MFAYFVNNEEKFHAKIPGMAIPLFQLFTSASTELVSLILIAQQVSVLDVVMNFVALAIISDIDNMFLTASRDMRIKKVLLDDGKELLLDLSTGTEKKFEDRKSCNKFYFALYVFFDFNYKVWYFYMFPFLCVLLNFFDENTVNCELSTGEDACAMDALGVN